MRWWIQPALETKKVQFSLSLRRINATRYLWKHVNGKKVWKKASISQSNPYTAKSLLGKILGTRWDLFSMWTGRPETWHKELEILKWAHYLRPRRARSFACALYVRFQSSARIYSNVTSASVSFVYQKQNEAQEYFLHWGTVTSFFANTSLTAIHVRKS